MDKPAQNIQDSFLNAARKERLTLTIFLLSGVKLTGRIRSFDKYCLVLESGSPSGSQEQMIFKHAISTVMLQRSGAHVHREGERHAPPAKVKDEGASVTSITAEAS